MENSKKPYWKWYEKYLIYGIILFTVALLAFKWIFGG